MAPEQIGIAAAAIVQGDHVRVGTEDYPFDRAGSLAETHELVGRGRRDRARRRQGDRDARAGARDGVRVTHGPSPDGASRWPTTEPVVLVTGAARGIGAAAARVRRAGYRVVGAATRSPARTSLDRSRTSDRRALRRAPTRRRSPRSSRARTPSTAHRRARQRRRRRARQAARGDDAGTIHARRDVNLGGTFLLCKHVIPVMKRQRRRLDRQRRLGLRPRRPDRPRALRRHQGGGDRHVPRARLGARARGIRINSVSPGSVDTAMLRGDIELEAERTGSRWPRSRRCARPSRRSAAGPTRRRSPRPSTSWRARAPRS